MMGMFPGWARKESLWLNCEIRFAKSDCGDPELGNKNKLQRTQPKHHHHRKPFFNRKSCSTLRLNLRTYNSVRPEKPESSLLVDTYIHLSDLRFVCTCVHRQSTFTSTSTDVAAVRFSILFLRKSLELGFIIPVALWFVNMFFLEFIKNTSQIC